MKVKILRHNDQVVWTEDSGLPYPEELPTERVLTGNCIIDGTMSDEWLNSSPRDNQVAVIAPAATVSITMPIQKAKSQPAPGTKLARAQIIFAAARDEGKTRKEIIAKFVTDLTMTEAGASTYYSMCQKASLN